MWTDRKVPAPGFELPCSIPPNQPSGYKGHVQIRINGRLVYAHVHAWEAVHGPKPADSELHHLCKVYACREPTHLIPLSRVEHKKLHPRPLIERCRNGHEFTPENTNLTLGYRRCRACSRENLRRSRKTRST